MSETRRCREVTACPNCGCTDLSLPPTNVDGFVGAAALDGRMYCKSCGREGLPILFDNEEDYQEFMRERGDDASRRRVSSSTIPELSEVKQKKPAAAALLSVFIPGLGHVYAGKPLTGLVAFVVSLLAGMFLGNLVVPVIFLVALDAYLAARRYNLRLSKSEPHEEKLE